MTRAEQIARGEDAARIMGEPLLIEAFSRVEQDAIEAMLKADDDDERRRLADRVNAIRDVQQALRTEITLGKAAQKGAVERP